MPAGADQKPKQLYEFGPFRVDPEKELLLRGEATVPLTPKTFQILLVLMRHSKEVVTKDDLMKLVWPDTFVEEANLSRSCCAKRWGKARRTTNTSSPFPDAATALPRTFGWRRIKN
jgi:DNA-binding response OmpR family regulator